MLIKNKSQVYLRNYNGLYLKSDLTFGTESQIWEINTDITDFTSGNTYALEYHNVDSNYNLSELVTKTITFDNIAPNPPAINCDKTTVDGETDNITISGEAESDTTVTLYTNGTEKATYASDGNYSFTTTITSTTQFYVTATDTAGNISDQSNPVTVTFDNTAPTQPNISSNETSTNGSVQISGEAESGTTVTLYANGTEEATYTSNGNYSFTTTITSTTQFYVTSESIIIKYTELW